MAQIARIRAKATTKSAKDTKNNFNSEDSEFSAVSDLSVLASFAVQVLRLLIEGAFYDIFDRWIFNGQVEHRLLGKQAGSDLGHPIGLHLDHALSPTV
jgi:hypothetical protein